MDKNLLWRKKNLQTFSNVWFNDIWTAYIYNSNILEDNLTTKVFISLGSSFLRNKGEA